MKTSNTKNDNQSKIDIADIINFNVEAGIYNQIFNSTGINNLMAEASQFISNETKSNDPDAKCSHCNDHLKNVTDTPCCPVCQEVFYCCSNCLLCNWKTHKEICLRKIPKKTEEKENQDKSSERNPEKEAIKKEEKQNAQKIDIKNNLKNDNNKQNSAPQPSVENKDATKDNKKTKENTEEDEKQTKNCESCNKCENKISEEDPTVKNSTDIDSQDKNKEEEDRTCQSNKSKNSESDYESDSSDDEESSYNEQKFQDDNDNSKNSSQDYESDSEESSIEKDKEFIKIVFDKVNNCFEKKVNPDKKDFNALLDNFSIARKFMDNNFIINLNGLINYNILSAIAKIAALSKMSSLCENKINMSCFAGEIENLTSKISKLNSYKDKLIDTKRKNRQKDNDYIDQKSKNQEKNQSYNENITNKKEETKCANNNKNGKEWPAKNSAKVPAEKEKINKEIDPETRRKLNFDFGYYTAEKSKNAGNIEYIRLQTVSQFDEEVTSDVLAKFNSLKKNNPKDIDLNGFLPGATCGIQALRNAEKINEFLKTYDQEHLNKINDKADAKNRLKELADADIPTSWLFDEAVTNLVVDKENITVLNSVLAAKTQNDLKTFFDLYENYHHVFIVNTGDITSSGLLLEQKSIIEAEQGQSIDIIKIDELLRDIGHGNHWYVIAIEKIGNNKRCFIIDSIPGKNRLDKDSLERITLFCEQIINGKSNIDSLISPLREIANRILHNSAIEIKKENEQPKNCKFVNNGSDDSKNNSLSSIIRKESTDLEEWAENSIYENCPEQFKEIIQQYRRATEKLKKISCRNINEYYKGLPSVIFLHGPNGTGKSDMAKLLAKKTNREIYFINTGYMGNTYQDSKGNYLRKIKQELVEQKIGKDQPIVIVLDEADSLKETNNKDTNNDSGSLPAAIAHTLDEFKEYNIILICTTNHIEKIGEKFITRAHCTIEVPLPNLNARKNILKNIIEGYKDPWSKRCKKKDLNRRSLGDYDSIAKISDGFNVRQLMLIIDNAWLKADKRDLEDNLNEVVLTENDFKEAATEIKNEHKNRLEKKKNNKTEEETDTLGVFCNFGSIAGGIALTAKGQPAIGSIIAQSGPTVKMALKKTWELGKEGYRKITK